MTEELSPRTIAGLASRGQISSGQAEQLFIYLHIQKAEHHGKRLEIGNRMQHYVAIPIHALVGGIVGLADGAAYGVSEIVGSVCYLASRTINSAKEGWEKGKR